MTDLDNIKDIDMQETMPTLHEELEVRRAFGRMHLSEPDVDSEWEKWMAANAVEESEVRSRESDNSTVNDTDDGNKYEGKITLLRWITFAAVACMACAFVIHGLYFRDNGEQPLEVFTAYQNSSDILMSTGDGKINKVNGESISFDGSSQQESATASEASARMKSVAISIPRGKNFQIILPDGTKVYLNADSKIEFPETFTGKERHVKVCGEAYMEVKHDEKHPFVVETEYFTTTVLGTVFDLRAYSAKDASLSLISGKVDVCDNQTSTHKAVSPNEQVTWSKDDGFAVKSVDTYPLTQWKDGFFYFDKTPLINIMQELGRWYNVSIVFENPDDMKRVMHIAAERNEKLSSIVKRINDLGIVRIEYKNKVITIK